MTIHEFQGTFTPYLKEAIEQKFQVYANYTQDAGILGMLSYAKEVTYGGKYVRPYMAYSMYESLKDNGQEEVIQALVSLEVFHAFALVHDDIIDKGTSRHGKPTVHTFITKLLMKEQRWSQDYEHVGNGQAILIGDLLFAWSLENFATFSHLPHYTEAWKYFMHMIDEVVVGQMIDVDIMTRDRVDMDLIETKMKLKTAGYTFVRPMHIGSSFAGYGSEMEQFCKDFGQALGLAFQVQDDVLDLVGDPQKIHKTVLSDIREHQHTFLTQYVFENGTKDDIRDLTAVWGSEIRVADQAYVIDIFQRTGALEFARQKIQMYLDRSKALVQNNAVLNSDGKDTLLDLVEYISRRSA